MILIAAAVLPGAASADQYTVRIYSSATVEGDAIRIANVCDLSGFADQRQSQLDQTMIKSSFYGTSTRIDADQIQQTLRGAGVNLADLVVLGASHCQVQRFDLSNSMPHPNAVAKPRRSDISVTATQGAIRAPAQAETARDDVTLRSEVIQSLQTRADALNGTVDVVFRGTATDILNLAEPQYRFVVDIRGDRWLGQRVRADVDVFTAGAARQTVRLDIDVTVQIDVVVARRPINQRANVRAEDVVLATRTYDSLNKLPARAIEEVIAMRAQHYIPVDSPVFTGDLESVPLVKRGDIVKVVSLAGGVVVRTAAKALGEGRMGDTVALEIGGRRRGQSVSAIVIGERIVQIGAPSARETDDADTIVALGADHAR